MSGGVARATGRRDEPPPRRTAAVAVGLLGLGDLAAYMLMERIPAPDWLRTVAVGVTFLGGGLAGWISLRLVERVFARCFKTAGGMIVYCLLALAPAAAHMAYFRHTGQAWRLPAGWSALAPAVLPLLPFWAMNASNAVLALVNAVGHGWERRRRPPRRPDGEAGR